MPKLIKVIKNRVVEYDKGKFDDYCVYIKDKDGGRYAPKDNEYFAYFNSLNVTTKNRDDIYKDYVRIYLLTTSKIEETVLKTITSISDEYGSESEMTDVYFTVIYAGMVAEENKQYAILKKRIKRLGMHQVLKDNISPEIAASFSKGRKWRELDKIMKEKGF